MEEVLAFLANSPPSYGLLAVFGAAAAEYLLPPLPADSVVLAGALLVVAGVAPFWAVYLAALLGSLLGATAHYFLGRAFADEHGHLRTARFLERMLGTKAMPRFFAAFRRYGMWVIAFNRAFPGIRAVTFLAAGAARLPYGRVMAAGLVSAAAWNALVLGIGLWVGNDWEKIRATFDVYANVVFAVGGAGLFLFVAVKVWQRRASCDRGGEAG